MNSTLTNNTDRAAELAHVQTHAKNLRRHVLRMAEIVGQGYVGQGLGIADLLAVLYFREMRYEAKSRVAARDRFVLSIGHYSIGLYAALAEAGVIPWGNSIPTARTVRASRCPAVKSRRVSK